MGATEEIGRRARAKKASVKARAGEERFFWLEFEEKKREKNFTSIFLSPPARVEMSAPPCAERMSSGFVTANDGVELAYSLWLPEGAQLGKRG